MKLIILFLIVISFKINAQDFRSKIHDEYEEILSKKYSILPHKGTYIIPFSYNHTPNNEAYKSFTHSNDKYEKRGNFNRDIEAEYQVSFQFLLAKRILSTDLNLFMAYTQQSWWQLYNTKWSRQFRETNYNPELFARKVFSSTVTPFGNTLVAYDIGYMHQSNGQVQEMSRSWDRIFLRTLFIFGKIIVTPTLWYRIPGADSLDENPHIERYLGYGELRVDRVYGRNRFGFKLIPGTKYAGAELSHSFPLSEGVRFFSKINYGYGMSLIDYNYKTQRIGIGITLTDLLSNVSN